MNQNGLEIERKFLIKMPDTALLERISDCKKVYIEQTYLSDRRRIRRWEEDANISYIVTFKEKITEMTRIERESEISKDEFDALMQNRDPSRATIKKVRYRIPFEDKLLEIDLFDFWKDRAFLEIELESETDTFNVPSFLSIIKEVTEDRRYRNSALAVTVPFDEI